MRNAGFLAGIGAFALMQALPAPEGLSPAAWDTASVTVLMGIWWFTEALPVAVTGLVPFLLLPLLGVTKAADVAADYLGPVQFLVIGGAFLGLAAEKTGLHRRVALSVLRRSGRRPEGVILALMVATAVVSAFVNNSTTTVMMLPIAAAVAAAIEAETGAEKAALFASSALLSIAIASNIGGFATPIGTPVNPVAIDLVERQFGVRITFAQWLVFGIPIVIAALPAAWWLLVRPLRAARLDDLSPTHLAATLGPLGPVSRDERKVIAVVTVASAAWISLPLLQAWSPRITDASIAVAAAVVLCALPRAGATDGARLLEWGDGQRAPWFLIVLLGGGLALADAVVGTGLGDWIAAAISGLSALPTLLLLLLIAGLCIAVTECSSNLATAATFVPIAGALAITGGHDPVPVALAAGMAASWGFANPAGTSSNAMVIGTGKVPAQQMIRAGLGVDAVGVLLIALACWLLVPLVA